MTDENDDLTVDDVKQLALDSDPLVTAWMLAQGGPLIAHLMMAAQAEKHTKDLREMAKHVRKLSDAPEHTDLASAIITASKAATVAFDAAANAGWQMYWMCEHCTCVQCTTEKRREQAPNN